MKKQLVVDANVWIFGLLQKEPYFQLIQMSFPGKNKVDLIINSYGAVETLHVLRRVARHTRQSQSKIEKSFWSILNQASCILDFEHPLKKNLLVFMRNKPEFLMLAQIFDLEPKDVPYLVLSFKHQAILVTEDYRSLYTKRKKIDSFLGVKIHSVEETLALLQK